MKFVDLCFEVHLQVMNGLYPTGTIVNLMLKNYLFVDQQALQVVLP